jgi:predicted ester cyclase
MLTTDNASTLRRLIEAVVQGDAQAISSIVTDNVSGWSPNMTVSSREELMEAVGENEGTFSNVETNIELLATLPDGRAVAEWRVEADHTGPVVIDEIVIAPTGRHLQLAGASFAEFEADRISAFRHYFDDAALLEQLVCQTAS